MLCRSSGKCREDVTVVGCRCEVVSMVGEDAARLCRWSADLKPKSTDHRRNLVIRDPTTVATSQEVCSAARLCQLSGECCEVVAVVGGTLRGCFDDRGSDAGV